MGTVRPHWICTVCRCSFHVLRNIKTSCVCQLQNLWHGGVEEGWLVQMGTRACMR